MESNHSHDLSTKEPCQPPRGYYENRTRPLLFCRQPLTSSKLNSQEARVALRSFPDSAGCPRLLSESLTLTSGKQRIRTPSRLKLNCLASSPPTLGLPSKIRPTGVLPVTPGRELTLPQGLESWSSGGLVPVSGFEPPTFSLSGSCPHQTGPHGIARESRLTVSAFKSGIIGTPLTCWCRDSNSGGRRLQLRLAYPWLTSIMHFNVVPNGHLRLYLVSAIPRTPRGIRTPIS